MTNIISLDKAKQHKKGSRRQFLRYAIMVFVIAAIIAGVYLFIKGGTAKPVAKQPAVTTKKVEPTRYENAAYILDKQGYAQAQQSLDSQLNGSASSATQSSVYYDKAVVALNGKQYDDAKNFALKADKLAPTVKSAQLVAEVARKSGDKATAVAYYKIAIDRMTDEEKKRPSYEEYQTIIKELSS